jgi:glucokinase
VFLSLGFKNPKLWHAFPGESNSPNCDEQVAVGTQPNLLSCRATKEGMIAMTTRWFLGCDLGGTNLRAGIADVQTGELSQVTSILTIAREGPHAVIARMADLLQSVLAAGGLSKSEVGGIGIGVPGLLDLERGTVLFLPNLPSTWPNVPLAGIISQKLSLPVFLLNDARSITYGEWKFGAGRGVDTMACFAIGTGIGGGLVIAGRLHLGIDGAAGELGHQTVEPDGLICGCGNRGCVEAYASGAAITAFGLKAVTQ